MKLLQYLHTKNECYKVGKSMQPKGFMIHSTAAWNEYLSRYVGSDDILGINKYNNHWNQFRPDGRQVCVHGFIGWLKDKTIATCQTLPFDMQGWHAGGKANQTYIGVEICEDSRNNLDYLLSMLEEASELVAHVMSIYRFPLDMVISHAEGHKRGIASNHGDIEHWLKPHGYTMDDFRHMVYQAIQPPKPEQDDLFRIRISWDKPETQVGAYKSLDGARSVRDRMNENIKFYKIYDEKGNEVK